MNFLRIIFLLLVSSALNAQLKSPAEFLGYEPGTKFTPHHRIVSYFQHAASNAASQMKLQQYGQTNEGRPLYVAFVSSPGNISRLETIRTNNLSLVSAKGNVSPDQPVIVWLSYNVHGNEPSSSEAAMATLYALLKPSDAHTSQWLANTIVIIDPCLNPDGRDRYVNWYNSVSGQQPDYNVSSREHREPWPGGRSNHYNFDLNRDWAWQTQVETRQRMKVYHEWMPQVHADFHEMGINSPYFFAPGAEPLHEVITPWQRSFHETIGRNHAKYFDQNGWLYFTKEYYDLYYPSYGDTYPLYNGAIGMTYEQGGGGAGGLAVINSKGDTLTLNDRVQHHFTTGLSTIEISSRNAIKLLTEFRKFFGESVSTGVGEYKSYIIKNAPGRQQTLRRLLELLDKNQISYSTGNATGKGFNYATRKTESFSIVPGDVVISALQPRSALIKVLFEPQGNLTDSNTYDITAWSLPYAYGFNAYASRDRINVTQALSHVNVTNKISEPYAYIAPWEGLNSAKFLAELLKKNIRVRHAEKPFTANGIQYARGSLIILKTGNQYRPNLWQEIRQVADKYGILLGTANTGFSDNGADFGSGSVRSIKAPRVAMLTGETVSSLSAGEVWHFFEKEIDYPVTLINAATFNPSQLRNIDVLIMPDGNYSFLSDKSNADKLRNWVSEGNKLIALEGATAALARAELGISLKTGNEDRKSDTDYNNLKKFSDQEREGIPDMTSGSVYRVELDNTHPLAFGYPDHYYTLKMDDRLFNFLSDGWNVGVIKKDEPLSGFVGHRLRNRIRDALVLGTKPMGNGEIVYFTDDVLFRSFWENGKLLFANSIFLVGQ